MLAKMKGELNQIQSRVQFFNPCGEVTVGLAWHWRLQEKKDRLEDVLAKVTAELHQIKSSILWFIYLFR